MRKKKTMEDMIAYMEPISDILGNNYRARIIRILLKADKGMNISQICAVLGKRHKLSYPSVHNHIKYLVRRGYINETLVSKHNATILSLNKDRLKSDLNNIASYFNYYIYEVFSND
jgi:repressor of nif and glnA expression